jgi:hypothetical protein
MSSEEASLARMAAGEWLELAVESDREAVESVAELFGRFGYNEGVVIDEPFGRIPTATISRSI